MKESTLKWLKRLPVFFAIILVLVAVLLTSARIFFVDVGKYKEQAITWLTTEYKINASVDDISAGIDFSGMVLTLNNVELLDSADLPFVLNLDYLFLHLDFWKTISNRKLSFKSVSLQGAELTVKPSTGTSAIGKTSKKSQITISTLKDIFLSQLTKVSIRDSKLNFTDQLGLHKVIIIDQLRWLNEGKKHQGVGNATLPDEALGRNSLKFVIDLFPETSSSPRGGHLYLQADNLNIADYLIKQVNPNAEIVEAVAGFEAWVKFSSDKVNSIQLQLKDTLFSWSLANKHYNWAIKAGLLQLSNGQDGWLLDSYDLDITRNQSKWEQLKFTGHGDDSNLLVNFEGLSVKDIVPFYLLSSNLDTTQISSLREFDLDANIQQVGISLDKEKDFKFSLKLDKFKNNPVGAIPGLSNANIKINGNLEQGSIDIHLPMQEVHFDGQFSRFMPIQSADIPMQWLQTEIGLKLFSEQTLLVTDELDTISQFSLLLPNENALNQSAFLSLYTYASLNDAGNAQYYFPIEAMGESVFEYLEPTIKKGHVEGAKILWYGAFNNYPYLENNGIFQAWVPLRDAQYDFYGQWEGLTNLDLDLLFENDYLLMDAKKATLGEVNVDKLSARVDHLNPEGILTIEAELTEDAQKISKYLKNSPLKESVGKALSVIEVSESLSGNLTLTVPFNHEELEPKSEGNVVLKNNNINILLADDLVMPLKKVNGSFSFVNGNLSATNIDASLFDQPLNIDFNSIEKKETYQVDAKLNGIWKLAKLSNYHEILKPLKISGLLDWSGQVKFTNQHNGGYQFDVELNSMGQGIRNDLPEPLHKDILQNWPTTIKVSGSDSNSHLQIDIKDKLSFDGMIEYIDGKQSVPYFSLNIGQPELKDIDKTKQVLNINLESLNIATWYEYWKNENANLDARERFFKEEVLTADSAVVENETNEETEPLFSLDEINVDVKHLDLFNQPLLGFTANTVNIDGSWATKITSDKLETTLEYRHGMPVRIDVNAEKVDFQQLDLNLLKTSSSVPNQQESKSENLRSDYPEVFIECKSCIYKEMDLSPLSMHVYPNKKRLNIDYINIGEGSEYTNITGFWDQRITNIIVDTEGDKSGSLVNRFGYTSPVYHSTAQLSGAFNWVGAPWQANLNSLNGAFSAILTDGAITEVSDNGAKLLSILSLDGIRRSLNLEFDNVFAKGFSFDEITLSGNIHDGVVSNDDFYLDGASGKLTGGGLIDLPNQATNYNFSYSPSVTSSLPVLAAFTINPLTGAAVLMLTKIFEPVVEAIIQVDFSVKGDLMNPDVKLVTREQGEIKLENSDVLQEMSKLKHLPQRGK